jgi:hypothetical protein
MRAKRFKYSALLHGEVIMVLNNAIVREPMASTRTQIATLNDKLKACSRDRRCRSLACGFCRSLNAKAEAKRQRAAIRECNPGNDELVFLTIVPMSLRFRVGSIKSLDFGVCKRQLMFGIQHLSVKRPWHCCLDIDL